MTSKPLTWLTVFLLSFAFLNMNANGTTTVSKKWVPKLEISITEDGAVWLEKEEISVSQFRALALAVAKISSDIRLLVRTDKNVKVEDIRKVIKAWGEAGFSDVIFGSVLEDPRKAPKNEADLPAKKVKVKDNIDCAGRIGFAPLFGITRLPIAR